ncbi:MFS transporter [Pseudonocardia endophytica]|uniref:Putative MFS family arabinose efflux permease n=1 Tax=Pseudonocardia endophytica TaxID=401976 RepID=A0A4R1HZB2_PSEEN|nr:MFS transporter [Pseudonocardia endophytica]TCK26911.1 putative MFS family arabinose efflux permease [Pseudonocardia endophytica]
MYGRDFRLLLLFSLVGFGGYALLLPAVPLWVARGGSGEFGAGLSTGVLMAVTVGTQLGVPALLRRFGHRPVLVAGALLLGPPSPLLILSADLAPVLVVCVLRGIGFGLLTVAGSALVAELVTPDERGRASARFGYAIGLPNVLLLPAGVGVADAFGFPAVFWTAGVMPVLAALVVIGMRPVAATPPEHLRPRERRPWRPGPPFLAMLGCATAQGAVVTFAPLLAPAATVAVPAALLLTGLAALVGRGVAGEIADRGIRPGMLLPAGVGATAVGLVLVAVAGTGGLVAGALLVGAGFGIVQNAALVALFAQAGPGGYGGASAQWNIGYDAGTGLGATALGAVAQPFGFGVAFGAAAAVLAVLTPAVLRRSPAG